MTKLTRVMPTTYELVVDDELDGFGSLIPLKAVCRMFGWTPEQVRPELARRKDLVPLGADGEGVFLSAQAVRNHLRVLTDEELRRRIESLKESWISEDDFVHYAVAAHACGVNPKRVYRLCRSNAFDVRIANNIKNPKKKIFQVRIRVLRNYLYKERTGRLPDSAIYPQARAHAPASVQHLLPPT